MDIIFHSVLFLSIIGGLSALILFVISKQFRVDEDVRINQVEEILPAANCGGCGFPGCRSFAENCVKSDTLEGKYCPVGGEVVMQKVATLLFKVVERNVPMVAVVRCNGSCEKREQTNQYDGAKKCALSSAVYGGESACSYGCLGYGDCEKACLFDAIRINKKTNLPEVIEHKCTACNACVKACPKNIIEMRRVGPRSRRIYVDCVNKDKEDVAKLACQVACIGCRKCIDVCEFDAIKITNNLAYIDSTKCRLCRKCPEVCPTSAIVEINLPPKK